MSNPDFESAIVLFNRQAFFECHEVLEDLWRPLPPGPEKTFLQGLIQIAVGLHHLQRHNFVGARNKLQSGLEKLKAAAQDSTYQPPFTLEPLMEATHQSLIKVLDLGPECLDDFPPTLIPTIPRFKSS